jgi:dihydroorotate dehydrogenase (fumarate)
MAHRLDAAGADGLVLFNRFLQPDIDPETLSTVRTVSLSTPSDTRLPLTWIALLHGRIRASLAASTGVEHASDVAKYLLAGADVVQCASALLRHGPEYAGVLLRELKDWMNRKRFHDLNQVRGLLAAPDAEDSEAQERADYVWALRKANSGIYETY